MPVKTMLIMDYGQNENKPTIASEAALAYNPVAEAATRSEVEKDCLPLAESKRLVLEMVHKHYHPEA